MGLVPDSKGCWLVQSLVLIFSVNGFIKPYLIFPKTKNMWYYQLKSQIDLMNCILAPMMTLAHYCTQKQSDVTIPQSRYRCFAMVNVKITRAWKGHKRLGCAIFFLKNKKVTNTILKDWFLIFHPPFSLLRNKEDWAVGHLQGAIFFKV